MEPLSIEYAKKKMQERGFEEVSVNKSGNEITKINFVKYIDDIILHSTVNLRKENVSLSFVNLKYFCQLTTGDFSFYHLDFFTYEQIILTYASKCLDIDVFETLKKLKGSKESNKEPESEEKSSTPKKDIKTRKKEFWNVIAEYGKEKGYSKEMCIDFYKYWIEMNEGGKKLRFEIEKSRKGVFDIKGRLRTWKSNEEKYNSRFKDKTEKKIESQEKERQTSTTIDKNKLF